MQEKVIVQQRQMDRMVWIHKVKLARVIIKLRQPGRVERTESQSKNLAMVEMDLMIDGN